MTIAYPVRQDYTGIIGPHGELIADLANPIGGLPASHAVDRAARIAAALNYCFDMTDDNLTEDSAGIVRADRDRLLTALAALQANPNDPQAHRTALDALAGR